METVIARNKTVTFVWALALTLGLGAVACAGIKNAFSKDPVGDHEGMEAVRVPATDQGRSCVERCRQQDDACFRRNEATGQTTPSDGHACDRGFFQCMTSCPGASLTISKGPQYKQIKGSEAARLVCSEGLAEGMSTYCLMRFGVATSFREPQPTSSNASPAGAGGSASNPKGPYKVGELVVARPKGSEFWLVGRVEASRDIAVAVSYLVDDVQEIVRVENVRPFDWGPGTQVECNWKRAGKFFSGKITALEGQRRAKVNYDDGDKETIDVGLCRSR